MQQIYQISAATYWIDANEYKQGYSGAKPCRNNPALCNVPNCGPIPIGEYDMEINPNPKPSLAQPVIRLIPRPGTNTFNRSDFEIHGNNEQDDASHGCIIQIHPVRLLIVDAMAKGNKILRVTA